MGAEWEALQTLLLRKCEVSSLSSTANGCLHKIYQLHKYSHLFLMMSVCLLNGENEMLFFLAVLIFSKGEHITLTCHIFAHMGCFQLT